MKRHFYLSNDLDDLEVIEDELEAAGLSTPQIHVISRDEVGLDKHRLNQVHQWFQTDVVRSTLKGAVIGAVLALTVIAVCYSLGVESYIGGMPFIFFSIVIFGFVTWEMGKEYQKIAEVLIENPNAPWMTNQGIGIGTTLEELIKINGKDIKFAGFEWE